MKIIEYTFFLFFALFSVSCKGQEETEIEKKLKDCINASVNEGIKSRNGKEPFEYYRLMIQVENILLEQQLLETPTKKEYHTLLKNILNEQKKSYQETYAIINKLTNEVGFDFELFIIVDNILNQCPYKVSIKEKDGDGKIIYNQAKILYELMSQDYNNEELFNELFNTVDENKFKKVVYRAPVILLTIINLGNLYR